MATQTREMSGWNSSWFADETPIQWEVKGNPKRAHGKSYARFEQYFGASTVKEYIENGGTRGDLKYDWQHAFLTLESDTDAAEIVAQSDDPADIIENALNEHKKSRRNAKPVIVVTPIDEEDLLA